ncbi:adenylyl-sulfate kinase [Phragmitibacter flavus]|uniref:Adenylyl-sulfate kinase n=1 Tax=Phragmitibacter flavus TaxID=2576071 RepID=A0A5R8KDR2_9BACT|nr:adenylyl-sulfate kinase [Phragmitibacter flavus]TLD70436.1 adenylyl-sulfate kinase [Phragmitibacter flavus]
MKHTEQEPSAISPVYWFFGRSGAGKSTLTTWIATRLRQEGHAVLLIDGDQVRRGLCKDLEFDPSSRLENHRRVAEVATLAASQNIVVLVATMAPLASIRRSVEKIIPSAALHWIFLDASLRSCIKRDPKALYKRAPGEGNPQDCEYEVPQPQEIHLLVPTETLAQNVCADIAYRYLSNRLAARSI